MGVTRERISRILGLREILLSFQTGFNLVNAAGVSAILESISGMGPSSDKLSSGAWSLWLSQAAINLLWSLCWCCWCCQLVLLGTDLYWLWKLCQDAQLILPVLILLLSQWYQPSRYWWLVCLQCQQCFHDLLGCLIIFFEKYDEEGG